MQTATHTHTHTHPFNGPLSGTTQVIRYQKGKTNMDFTESRDSEWQWHQLGRMQVCTSLQTDIHASTPPLKFFTDRMPFLPPSQQRQSTEGKHTDSQLKTIRKLVSVVSLRVEMEMEDGGNPADSVGNPREWGQLLREYQRDVTRSCGNPQGMELDGAVAS